MNCVKQLFHRYLVQAMSAMALGLFSSLIIGLIISQFAKIPSLEFLAGFTQVLSADSPVVGGAIGAAIAYGLKHKPLVIFSCVAVGAFGYSVGGPVGAYLGAVLGAEVGGLVAGKTKVDIILTPIVTILSGCLFAQLTGPAVQALMTGLGNILKSATELEPLPMGILISVIVGLALTAPISSAALCIMMELDGLAGGAAVVGCCCQMVGFAVASFRDNGWGGLISQGIGTSMLQFSNICRRPIIWLAPTLASAVLGPVSTCLLRMTCTASGAGMGTSGLVGQFGTWASMSSTIDPILLIGELLLMHFVLPAALTLLFDLLFRKFGWIHDGDMKLQELK